MGNVAVKSVSVSASQNIIVSFALVSLGNQMERGTMATMAINTFIIGVESWCCIRLHEKKQIEL